MKRSLAEAINRTVRTKVPLYKLELPMPERLMGIEIEVENYTDNIFDCNVPGWESIHDGSLRNGIEFKLSKPMCGEELGGAIKAMFDKNSMVRRHTSSTHIHADMLEGTVTEDSLQALFLLVFITEEILYEVGDPGRKWCGFTNPLTHLNERNIAALVLGKDKYNELYDTHFNSGYNGRQAASSRRAYDYFSDVLTSGSRYVGLNVQALFKYGSVEFRYFPTPLNKEELINWVRLVQSYLKAAQELDGKEALERMMQSENSYNEFISTYFYDWKELFMKYAPYGHANTKLKYALTLAESAFAVQVDVPTAHKVANRFKRKKREDEVEQEEEAVPAMPEAAPAQEDSTAGDSGYQYVMSPTLLYHIRHTAPGNQLRDWIIQYGNLRSHREFVNECSLALRRRTHSPDVTVAPSYAELSQSVFPTT